MDKISHILPSSPRVTSTDESESHPVRPGVPAFGGAPTGTSRALKAKLTRGLAEGAESDEVAGQDRLKLPTDHVDWRTKDLKHAAIASSVSSAFFRKAGGDPDQTKLTETQVAVQSRADQATKEQVANHAQLQYRWQPIRSGGGWTERKVNSPTEPEAATELIKAEPVDSQDKTENFDVLDKSEFFDSLADGRLPTGSSRAANTSPRLSIRA